MTSLHEMRNQIRKAEKTLENADACVGAMLPLIAGRLREANFWNSRDYLRKIKAELKDFDSRTGRWD